MSKRTTVVPLADLHAACAALGRPAMLVLGDVMLDRATWGRAARISPEAPVPVFTVDRSEACLGGAANVARVLSALGAQVTLLGAVGTDSAALEVEDLCAQAGVDPAGLRRQPGRRTTVKERLFAQHGGRPGQQLGRVDWEDRQVLPTVGAAWLEEQVLARLPSCQALVISDYGKGVCTPALLRTVLPAAHRHEVPVLIDPARRDDYSVYRGGGVLKPNRTAAERASGQRIRCPADALVVGARLVQRLHLTAVVITLDQDGLALVTADGRSGLFPARARTLVDGTGAGDVVAAVLGLGLASRLPLEQALVLANAAAGLAVEQVGNVVVDRAALVAAIAGPRATAAKVVAETELLAQATRYRQQGQRLVFANGCFDLLHAGHVAHLEECAAAGDILIVGVNSDASVRRLKGAGRPVLPAEQRARLIAALGCVDLVTVFDADEPTALIAALRPDVLAKGGGYALHEVVGRAAVTAYGGQVLLTSHVPDCSTTQTIAAAQAAVLPPPEIAQAG